jgi:two-component system phosphate regulon sensor histidine kinase PhoR
VDINDFEDRTVLTVNDNGIGIPLNQQERVFERFYRVDKSRSRALGGTGLGLSIVKHGAQYHGARLSLDSAPGEGTRVTLTFSTEKS